MLATMLNVHFASTYNHVPDWERSANSGKRLLRSSTGELVSKHDPSGTKLIQRGAKFHGRTVGGSAVSFSTYQSQKILGQTKNRRRFFRTRCLLTASVAAGFSSSNPLQSVSNEVCCVTKKSCICQLNDAV